MIAAAILHPHVSPSVVTRFKTSGVEIQIRENLEENESYVAALIFGGDGTVHRHLPELFKRRIPFLVVPVGSGNDFAKALGNTNEEIALQAWNQFCNGLGNAHEIDLGVIRSGREAAGMEKESGILFCCVAAIGMDADANARANRMPTWLKRRGGYLVAALESLVAFRAVEIYVAAGRKEIRRPAFFVAVGNAHRYGGGMKITPRATADDALLDVCFLSKMNKLKLLCWMPTIFFGGHPGLREVDYFQAPTVQIEAARELSVYADGEYVCGTPIKIEVIPRAIKVILPVTTHSSANKHRQ